MTRSWLKNLRREHGVEVSKIMDAVGISRQYYNMLEAGTRNPSVTVAQKIADILNFNWTLFFSADELKSSREDSIFTHRQ